MKVNIDLLEKVRDSLVLVLTEKGYHTPFHYKLSPDEENIFVFHLQIVDRTNARLNSKLQGHFENAFPGRLSFVLQTDALDIDTTLLYKSITKHDPPVEENSKKVSTTVFIDKCVASLEIQFFAFPEVKKPSQYTNIRKFMKLKKIDKNKVPLHVLLKSMLTDECDN